MSDIQRIPFATEQVTIPQTNITEAPLPGRSPIAEAVGQAAGVAGTFIKNYQKAQFAFDATEANLEITKRINAYQENLRNNPILPVIGENIVQTKQKNWQEFSDDLQKDFISQINNEELKMVLTDDWKAKSEGIRNDVVNLAIDENISFMSNRLSDDVNELVLAGDFDGAERAIALGEESALLSRDQAHDFNAFVDRNELMAKMIADETTFSDGKNVINSSNLTTEEKGNAQKIWKDREDERIRVEKERLKARQEVNMEEGFLGISQKDITTFSQLDAMLAPDGRYGENTSVQGEKLRAALRRNQDERDGKEPRDDPAALRRLDDALMSNITREKYLEILHSEGGNIQGATYIKYRDYADDAAFGKKNEEAVKFYESEVQAMAKNGFFGKDAESKTAGINEMMAVMRDMQFSDALTGDEIAREQGFTLDTAKQVIANFQDQIVGKLLRDQPIREDDGKFHWTDVEKLIEHGLEGRLFGRTNIDQLSNFLNDSTMSTATLQNNVARDTFARNSYDDLSRAQKQRVDVTVAVGQLVRKAEDVFKLDYPGVDAIMGIEIETNLPTARTADGLYRLEIEEAEEKWKVWDGQIGEYVEDTSVSLPVTKTTPPLVRDWNVLQDLLQRTPDTDLPEIQTRRRFLSDQLLESNEDIIPQGSANRARSGRTRGIGE